jgi:peptidoglycan/xylan/chitin deacetylase (PgdA/CDA1 family)
MDIIFLAKNLNKNLIEKYLLEDNFEVRFSLKQKLYYNFLRPIIPVSIRQKIQHGYNNKVKYKENFINPEFVDKVKDAFPKSMENLYPVNYKSAVILTHDVEEREGFNFIPKVIELERELGFKSSWNIVPYKYKIDQGIINLINENKHEIGIHGFNHDGKLYYSKKIFNERVPFINEAIKEYGAVGFRSPMVHRNLEWLQKLDIDYDASCFDYDPFQPFPGGTGSIWPFIAGKFVELPYTLPQDHTLFYVLKQKDINIWINKINWLKKNNGMILVLTHPDYLITSHHLHMYKELLEYLKDLKGVWFCLPKEMADWWKKSSSVPNN